MSKLLKSDFYRLFRSKSFYICGFIGVALFNLSIIGLYYATKMMADQTGNISAIANYTGILYGISAFADMDNQIILSIILGMFVTSEFSHGTMKNSVSKGFSRISIYFSKLITMVVASYIVLLVTFVTGVISGSLVTGKIGDFSKTPVVEYAKMVSVELILYAAFAALLVFVGFLIRNLGGVIAINIIGVTMFIPILCNLLQMFTNNKVMFTYASLRDNMSVLISGTEPDYMRTIFVAVIYLVISTGIGILAFTKTDVK